jgi:hypothetical protein
MKTKLYLLMIGFLLLQSYAALQAQAPKLGSFTEFRVGQLDPKDTKSGTLFGLAFGNGIDDKLYWEFEANYFRKSFTEGTVVPDTVSGGTIISTKQVELDYTTTILSLFFGFVFENRFGGAEPGGSQSGFYFRGSAVGGWEFIWSKERNFVDDISRTRKFDGPGFQLTAGLGYRISYSGILYVDALYNGAIGKTGETRTEEGLPTFEQIDVTGVGFRVGLNLYNIKIF